MEAVLRKEIVLATIARTVGKKGSVTKEEIMEALNSSNSQRVRQDGWGIISINRRLRELKAENMIVEIPYTTASGEKASSFTLASYFEATNEPVVSDLEKMVDIEFLNHLGSKNKVTVQKKMFQDMCEMIHEKYMGSAMIRRVGRRAKFLNVHYSNSKQEYFLIEDMSPNHIKNYVLKALSEDPDAFYSKVKTDPVIMYYVKGAGQYPSTVKRKLLSESKKRAKEKAKKVRAYRPKY